MCETDKVMKVVCERNVGMLSGLVIPSEIWQHAVLVLFNEERIDRVVDRVHVIGADGDSLRFDDQISGPNKTISLGSIYHTGVSVRDGCIQGPGVRPSCSLSPEVGFSGSGVDGTELGSISSCAILDAWR